MTLYVASLFLPYTIDFEADAARTAPPDDSDTVLIEGRLADLHRKARVRALSLTPGATTEDEKIFKPFYASRSAADDPHRPAPTEVPVESWGSSRKFNQPLSKATNYPGSSILSGPAVPSEKPVQTDHSDSEDSNRRVILSDVDWIVKSSVQGNGGLRNAINAAVREDIVQDKVWVGTLGMPTDLLKDHTRASIADQLEEEYDSLTVFVSDSEFEGHYFHYCRNILYPAFHYQMQESPRNKDYDEHSWNQYVKLNEHYADVIESKWKPGDRIWIHDYHLMLLPGLLRRRLGDAEIGFFMHTAFPSSEVFRCLTHRTALLEGLLGANLIGLQTGDYVYHFLHTVTRILGLEVSAEGIRLPDRTIPVKAFPMGVDDTSLDIQRNSTEVKNWEVKISEKYKGKRLIVARDRLDAAGGIKQKLLAYEQFLKRYPEWRESVVLVQVASSASEATDLEAVVSKIAMKINSNYSTLTHQPLVLLKQDISFAQFLALMSVAEIFMITSLREGMNLSGHDFVLCQDGNSGVPQKYGSLILSEFTGSASIWSKHELVVNPWDYAQCADAINSALVMSPQHRKENWMFLMGRMARNTASMWCSSYLTCLRHAYEIQSSRDSTVTLLSSDALRAKYNSSTRRMFILDEHTIFSATENRSSRLALLKSLSSNPQNTVYLTSSRTPKQLESSLASLPDTGLIAENGAFLREPGRAEWQILVTDTDNTPDWRWGVHKLMQYYRDRTDGTSIEQRQFSLIFHFHDAPDRKLALRHSSEMTDQINGSRGNAPIRAVMTDDAVTVEPTSISLAAAADLAFRAAMSAAVGQQQQQQSKTGLDFLVVCGSDESVFRWASQIGRKGVLSVARVSVDELVGLIGNVASEHTP